MVREEQIAAGVELSPAHESHPIKVAILGAGSAVFARQRNRQI